MRTARAAAQAVWASLLLAGSSCGSRQQFARLGDLPLERGGAIHDCRLGYRTFGRLDDARSNAILFLTWMEGTSAQLAWHVGPGRLLDSDRFFVVAVDALGNGVSSSPSNSSAQPGERFPTFTIRDLVESQRRLVTGELKLGRLKAVVGISLGGMQALEWATSHPSMVEKVVAIAASPRLHPSDLEFWRSGGQTARPETVRERVVRAIARVAPFDALLHAGIDPLDHRRQIQALLAHDISAPLGGSMERVAAAVRAQMLIVVSERDDVVNSAPALELARLTRAQTVTLDGRCGHQATRCERELMWSAVRRFLAE